MANTKLYEKPIIITIRVDDKVLRKVDKKAKANKMSRNAFINQHLNDTL